MDEWIKDVLHIHNGIIFIYEKNENLSFEIIWIELEVIMLNEVSTEKQVVYGLTCMWNLK
jgi:hypothetical protein